MHHSGKSYNFPKGTLFTQLPGGIFAKHPGVPETHHGYGHLIRRSEDNIHAIHNALNGQQGVAEGLNEFSPAGGGIPPRGPKSPGRDPWGGDDGPGEDPYKYPQPEHYSRSIDFFGQFEAGHFDDEVFNDATGEFRGYWNNQEGRDQIAYFKFDNPRRTGDNDPGMGWYYEPQNESVAEAEYNQEYDDEAGMAQSNLVTSARAVKGLLDTIKDRDNLPEWVQEKIAKAEMMLVSVWDYLQSQKELGMDPKVNESRALAGLKQIVAELSNEKLGQYKKAASAQASAADKAGDYAKGNKRFSGIVKATKKQFANDEKKVAEEVDEGLGSKLAGLGLAGAMALGAGGAHARVTGDEAPGINRLTGKPNTTQQAVDPAKAEAPKGFSKEYLQKAADPNRFGRYMISVEKAQELLNKMNAVDEAKKKGADGKACWKGYRYAGTENGKDKCVPVGEDVENIMGALIENLIRK
jgi:hypothetical protein